MIDGESLERAVVVLDAAIARVKQGWTRYCDARNADGVEVPYDDDTACKWCMFGALHMGEIDVSGGDDALMFAKRAARTLVEDRCGYDAIGPWNDAPGRTAEEVVTLLEQAKERAVHWWGA